MAVILWCRIMCSEAGLEDKIIVPCRVTLSSLKKAIGQKTKTLYHNNTLLFFFSLHKGFKI